MTGLCGIVGIEAENLHVFVLPLDRVRRCHHFGRLVRHAARHYLYRTYLIAPHHGVELRHVGGLLCVGAHVLVGPLGLCLVVERHGTAQGDEGVALVKVDFRHVARLVGVGGALSWDFAYYGSHGLRPACNLSSDLLVSDTTDSDGCYTIVYNQPPTAPGTITVPSEVIGGENLSISWGQSTDPDGNLAGYKLERKVDDGTWAQIYSGSSRSYTDSITYGWTSVQYRVKAYDTAGAESAYTTSAVRTVTNNRPPVISGSDTDLGSFTTTPPSYEYTVTDADGHQVTVVEKLDTTTLRTYTATLGDTNELEITADQFRRSAPSSKKECSPFKVELMIY